METKNEVTISQTRYEELLDMETRVNVLVERLCHNSFLTVEDTLWILGTELAVEEAKKLRSLKCLINTEEE